MSRPARILVAALALCLACAAPAVAAKRDLLTIIGNDYADDQRLDPCRYSEKDLRKLKDLIPNDAQAYAADFVAAVDDALARRAEGACNKKAGGSATGPAAPPAVPGGTATPPPSTGVAAPPSVFTPGTPAPAQAPPTPGAAPTAAPDVAARDAIGIAARTNDPATGVPFPILALAVLAGLLATAGLLAGLVRWRAWEPAWAERFGHAAGEAGWRASTAWSEFADFVRFGR